MHFVADGAIVWKRLGVAFARVNWGGPADNQNALLYWVLPHWLVALTLAASPLRQIFTWVFAWRRSVVERQRRAASRCTVCGYDLRATPDRCPECGTDVATVPSSGTPGEG